MITIIIPTKNRAHLLIQNLRYLTSIGMKVLVIDGSIEVNSDALNLPINYVHAPGVCLSGRAKLAFKHLDTKYFTFCADDDLLCPSGLDKMLKELDSSVNLVAVQGRHLQFSSDNYSPGKILPHTYESFNNLTVHHADPCVRLFKSNSFPVNFYCYAVCRREVLENFSCIADAVIGSDHSPVAFEPLMGFAVALTGSFKSLNAPHLVRRVSTPWQNPSFDFLLSDKGFLDVRAKLIDLIIAVLQSKSKSTDSKIPDRDFIGGALDQYVESMKMRAYLIPISRGSSTYMRSAREVFSFLFSRLVLKLHLLFSWHSVPKKFFESDAPIYADFLSDSKYIYQFVNSNK